MQFFKNKNYSLKTIGSSPSVLKLSCHVFYDLNALVEYVNMLHDSNP